MKLTKFAAAMVAAPMLMGTLSVAFAEDMADKAIGVWLREKEGWQIEFKPCGDKLCGEVISGEGVDKKTGGPVVGVQMLFDLEKKNDDTWVGKMYNPGDGNEYKGKVKVLEADRVKMSGCMLGGLVCRSEKWPRVEVAAMEPPADEMMEDAAEMMDEASETMDAAAADMTDETAAEAMDDAGEMMDDAADDITDAADDMMDEAADAAEDMMEETTEQ